MTKPIEKRTRCQECGGHGPANEYHPFAYCVLVKALGEDSARANLNTVLTHGRQLERQGLPNNATLDRVSIPPPPKPRKRT